jgi:endonuclease III
MKDGTRYAGRLKKAYAKLRQSVAEPKIPEVDDPIRRLAIAILGMECGDAEASRAIDRIFTTMVDWNEVRVSSVAQVYRAMGDRIPQGLDRARQMLDALQAIYEREHRVSLDLLHNIGRREARDYLEALPGVDDFAAASVMLWSFGGHAIPVSDKLLSSLREAELIHPAATRAEVQAFLERNVIATQAKEFTVIMRSFAASKRGSVSPSKTAKTARKKGAAKKAVG